MNRQSINGDDAGEDILMPNIVNLDSEVIGAESDAGKTASRLKPSTYVIVSVVGALIGILGVNWLRGSSPDPWILAGSMAGTLLAAWEGTRHMNKPRAGLKITTRLVAFAGVCGLFLGVIGFGVSPFAWHIVFLGVGLLMLSTGLLLYDKNLEAEEDRS